MYYKALYLGEKSCRKTPQTGTLGDVTTLWVRHKHTDGYVVVISDRVEILGKIRELKVKGT